MNKKTITGIVIIVISLLFVFVCGRQKDKTEAETRLYIKTRIAAPLYLRPGIIISGNLEALDQTSLAFKIGGRVSSVLFDVGDPVRKDTVMASLDQDEIKAIMTQAELGFEKLSRDHKRVKELFDDGAATKEQLQDITTALENARQQLNTAKYNLQFSKIWAPYDGHVAMRRHEPDEMIQAGDPVYIFVGDLRRLKVSSGVAGKYLDNMKENDFVEVTVHDHPNIKFQGELVRIGAAADPYTGTFPIEILVDNPNSILRPGMIAAVKVSVGEEKPVLAVPPESLVEADEDRGYLFTYDPSTETVKKQPVKLGDIVEGVIIILEGIKEGDEIVVEGAQFLVSGEKVIKQQ